MKRFVLFAATLAFGFVSCGEDPVADEIDVMDVDPSSMTINLPYERNTFRIPLSSTESVTAVVTYPEGTPDNEKGWLNEKPEETRALTSVKKVFEAQQNNGSTERSATITLTMGAVSKTFSVKQSISSIIVMDIKVEPTALPAGASVNNGVSSSKVSGISEFGGEFFVKIMSDFPWTVKFNDSNWWVTKVSGGPELGGFTVRIKAARENTIFDYAKRLTVVNVVLDNGAKSCELIIEQNPRTPGSYLIDIPEPGSGVTDNFAPGTADKNGTLVQQWGDSRIAKMILGEVEEFRNGVSSVTVTNASNAASQAFTMTARDFEAINALIPNLKTLNLGATNAEVIPEGAFQRALAANQTLEEVVFPQGLKEIKNGAFKGCYKLLKLGELPKTLTRIEDEAFLGAELSSTNLVIPNTLQYLGTAAFAGSMLTGLSFDAPEATTVAGTDTQLAISDYAFFSPMTIADPFSTKTPPDSFVKPETKSTTVQNITIEVNPNQANLKGGSVNMSSGFRIPDWVSSIGKGAFYGISYNGTSAGKLTIGKKVNYLGEGAFFMCKGINGVEFSDGGEAITLAEIESVTGSSTTWHGVFSGTGITSVKFPMHSRLGLTHVPNRILAYCENLTEVTMENTIEAIRPSAFQGSKISTKVTFSDNLRKIYASAFADTSVLPDATWDLSNTKIDTIYNNFMNRSVGVPKIIFPSTLKSFGAPVSLSVDANPNANYVYIYNDIPKIASQGNMFMMTEALAGTDNAPKSKIKEVDFSKTQITMLQNGTFNWCKSLEVVRMPAFVKPSEDEIAAGASPYMFFGTGVTLYQIKTVGTNKDKWAVSGTNAGVFLGCNKLTKIVFPKSMEPSAGTPAWPDDVRIYPYAFGKTIERAKVPGHVDGVTLYYSTSFPTADQAGSITNYPSNPAAFAGVAAAYE